MTPVLLLIPGMLGDGEVWSDVANALASRAEVRVAEVAAPTSITAMAHGAWEALANVADDRPLFIAGFSLGGYVAIDMLCRSRRRVRGGALLSTSARPETPESAAMRAKSIDAFRTDFPKAVERIIQWGTEQPDAALLERLRQMMLRIGADAAIRQTEAIMGRADHRAALARLALPIRVLCGADDRVTPPALSQELAALIPGAQLQCIDGVGHMLPCEQPHAVAQALGTLIGQPDDLSYTPNNGDKS